MVRKEHAKESKDCKLLPAEAVTTQHRVLVSELEVRKTRQRRTVGRKHIRWWKPLLGRSERELQDKYSGETIR